MELERIYGITNGGNRGNQYNKKEAHWNNSNLPTQKDLADQIGIDQSQLINYKKLTTLIPELQDLIETDQIKATAGYKIWAKMSTCITKWTVQYFTTKVLPKHTNVLV
ncbi:MAG: hypothetical protein GX340_00285 [Clostridiales bacterium]|nr:hypothetical protein [Clostridiales bacterium]